MTTTPQAGAGDPYAAARSDMRDTTKWLASTFAAVAAVVVAGTPFSSIGAMDLGDPRLHVAAGSVLLALAALMLAIAKTFALLRSDGIFASELAFDPKSPPKSVSRELRDVVRQINDHASDLLPPNPAYQTLKPLLDARAQTFNHLQDLLDAKPRDLVKVNQAVERLSEFDDPILNILHFAQYWRRYARVKEALPWLAGYAVAALVFLFVFAWAAKPPAPDSKPQPCIVCPPAPVDPPLQPPSCVQPIRFITGKAHILDDEISKISCVRDFLRIHTNAGVLLMAYTDTVSSDRHNVPLALARARAVRAALVEQGGVTLDRVFIGEFPEQSLPVLTNDERAEAGNRSVRFTFFRLPK